MLGLYADLSGSSAARQRQAVLQPGMVFAFEPNACIGNHRVNIGGTVIVTGSPEDVAASEKSYTGQFLKPLLAR